MNFVSWEDLLEENNPDIFHKIYPKDNNTLPELCAVYGQRFFKGGWVFSRFTTNHKFDAPQNLFSLQNNLKIRSYLLASSMRMRK